MRCSSSSTTVAREAVVVRVVNGARASTLTLRAGDGMMRLRAVRPGTREFLRASVDYDNVAAAGADEFNLTVQRVRVQGTAQSGGSGDIFAAVGGSRCSPVLRAPAGGIGIDTAQRATPARCAPDRTLDANSGLATAYVHSNADGDDGAPLTDYDVIGSELEKSGVFALDTGDYFNLLCIPPLSREQDVGVATLVVAAPLLQGAAGAAPGRSAGRVAHRRRCPPGHARVAAVERERRHVFSAHPRAGQVARSFRIVCAVRRRRRTHGACGRSGCRMGTGKDRGGDPASRVSPRPAWWARTAAGGSRRWA